MILKKWNDCQPTIFLLVYAWQTSELLHYWSVLLRIWSVYDNFNLGGLLLIWPYLGFGDALVNRNRFPIDYSFLGRANLQSVHSLEDLDPQSEQNYKQCGKIIIFKIFVFNFFGQDEMWINIIVLDYNSIYRVAGSFKYEYIIVI